MRRTLCRLSDNRNISASTAVLGILAVLPGQASGQGSNVDIAPVEVTAKKQQKPAVKRPTKPVAAKPTATELIAARPVPRPVAAKVVVAAPKRVAESPSTPPAAVDL